MAEEGSRQNITDLAGARASVRTRLTDLGRVGASIALFPIEAPFAGVDPEWTRRQAAWRVRHHDLCAVDYREALVVYEDLSQIAAATNRTLVRFASKRTPEGTVWVSIQAAAQQVIKERFPDIHPADALRLGRETVFSADEWWRGCTSEPERI